MERSLQLRFRARERRDDFPGAREFTGESVSILVIGERHVDTK
jgi:hypothetical protein